MVIRAFINSDLNSQLNKIYIYIFTNPKNPINYINVDLYILEI